MKKIISLNLFVVLGLLAHGQVYINVEESNEKESAILQIDSNTKGISLPHVFLESITQEFPISSTPAEGLLVYNPNLTKEISPGYYYWTSSPTPHWERVGGINEKGTIIQNIDKEFLGYNPTGIGANAPASFSFSNGGVATKQRCAKWEINEGGNGHVYCAYTSNQSKDFGTTFNAIKSVNGYMVTIVSDAEWNFVKNNIINDGQSLGGSTLNNGIWLGYVKFTTPGNTKPKYHWITNESWENKWSNDAKVQHQFAEGKPESASANNDHVCTFIQTSASSTNRLWSSQGCNATSNMNNLIIEFNQ